MSWKFKNARFGLLNDTDLLFFLGVKWASHAYGRAGELPMPVNNEQVTDRIIGQIRNAVEGLTPSGFRIRVCVAGDNQKWEPVAVGFSHIDGGFSIGIEAGARRKIFQAGSVQLSVDDRFGQPLTTVGPIPIEVAFQPIDLLVKIDPREDQPVAPVAQNPFESLAKSYEAEIGALRRADITNWASLAKADLEHLSRKLDMSTFRLEAFRLNAEMAAAVPLFDRDAAEILVAAGVKTVQDLAWSEPEALARRVGDAIASGKIEAPTFTPIQVPSWIALARGWTIPHFVSEYTAEQIQSASKFLGIAIQNSNPLEGLVAQILAEYWAQVTAASELRSIMSAAGISDLSALNPFVVRGPVNIGPGFHFSLPRSRQWMLDDGLHLPFLIQRGFDFDKVKAVRFTDYGVHIEPNPVTDAVILGPILQFIQNGELIIGSDVTSLIVVTDSIDYNLVHRIRYEDKDRLPAGRPPVQPRRPGPPRVFPFANDRSVYTPDGHTDNGRDGLRGLDGVGGGGGFPAEPAPSVKLYIKSAPNGYPDIDLNGRRGGRGQDAQDGGRGEDGAKGRESTGSFWLFCVSEVGHGGHGGDGGSGGPGGGGGLGGNAGSISIYAPMEAFNKIVTRPGMFLGMTGGPGGEPGQGGAPGAPGVGGDAGHDTAGCNAHPEWHGVDGAWGVGGPPGNSGQTGRDGQISFTPISIDQWNAAFHFPFLLRLEPALGPPGTKVHVVAKNLTTLASLTFDRLDVGASIDVPHDTADFTVPPGIAGGLKAVIMSVPQLGTGPGVPGLTYGMSNTVDFRVTPKLAGISPASGVPGQELVLTGDGFADGVQARFGGLALPLTRVDARTAKLTLPAWEDIGLPAGVQKVQVINPDAFTSEEIDFTLSLEYVVRMKAWRVYADGFVAGGGGLGGGPLGTGRDTSEIHNLLVDDTYSPRNTWLPFGIRLELDPVIEDAFLPSPWGDGSVPLDGNPVAATLSSPGPGGRSYVDNGAINFYFVSDIDDASTYAFTQVKFGKQPPYVVYEDTASLSTEREAKVASHEVGHALRLPHVCSRGPDAQDPSTTTFGRFCKTPASESADREYLMYPQLDFISHNGTTITVQEAIVARHAAIELHGK